MTTMQRPLKNHPLLKPIIGFSLIIDFIILDQITKWLVLEFAFKPKLGLPTLDFFSWITSAERLEPVRIEVMPYFNLTMVWNHGISFGMFQGDNPWPLIIIALVISIIFGVWLSKAKNWVEAICLPMVIGGAIGNVIDRLHFHAVADFLDFYVGEWHYPAFNLADSFISVGIVILVVNSLFFDRDNKKAE
ncbi:MAG TPA: signal peptidase II [Alphaproteobacteria bacterium]|nr:signal peptidase II [Alphaproteobacteria bacterium]